ncbi:MAG TPA: glycine zipper domain-containing protein, partial [Gemmatimonadales bacterium]|nr:glycine zipper domain-containing protein [Gemmatimonadales bacterium]
GTLTLRVSCVPVHGKTYDLDASLDSLLTVNEGRGIEPVDAARVGVGAAAGAILGRVIGGNSKGTIIGGAIGGVTGAVVSVVMKDMDVVLPAGSHLMLTLRQRLTVTAR